MPNLELDQAIAHIKSVISTFAPQERATCVMLLEASVRANAADAWSDECEAIVTDIMAALNGPPENIRGAVMGALTQSGERMAKRLGALKEELS
jgi:hypothetical protein